MIARRRLVGLAAAAALIGTRTPVAMAAPRAAQGKGRNPQDDAPHPSGPNQGNGAAVTRFLPPEIGFWMRISTDTRIADDGIHVRASYSPTGERVFWLGITQLTPAAARKLVIPREVAETQALLEEMMAPVDFPDLGAAGEAARGAEPAISPDLGLRALGGTMIESGGHRFVATRMPFDGLVYWGRIGQRVVVTCDATDPEMAQKALDTLDWKGLARLAR